MKLDKAEQASIKTDLTTFYQSQVTELAPLHLSKGRTRQMNRPPMWSTGLGALLRMTWALALAGPPCTYFVHRLVAGPDTGQTFGGHSGYPVGWKTAQLVGFVWPLWWLRSRVCHRLVGLFPNIVDSHSPGIHDKISATVVIYGDMPQQQEPAPGSTQQDADFNYYSDRETTMTNVVIAGSGLYTPKDSISNEQLVES